MPEPTLACWGGIRCHAALNARDEEQGSPRVPAASRGQRLEAAAEPPGGSGRRWASGAGEELRFPRREPDGSSTWRQGLSWPFADLPGSGSWAEPLLIGSHGGRKPVRRGHGCIKVSSVGLRLLLMSVPPSSGKQGSARVLPAERGLVLWKGWPWGA